MVTFPVRSDTPRIVHASRTRAGYDQLLLAGDFLFLVNSEVSNVTNGEIGQLAPDGRYEFITAQSSSVYTYLLSTESY